MLWNVRQCEFLIRIWCINRAVSGGVMVLHLVWALSLSLLRFLLCDIGNIYFMWIRIWWQNCDFVYVVGKRIIHLHLIFLFVENGWLDIWMFSSSWHISYFWSSIVLDMHVCIYFVLLISNGFAIADRRVFGENG
jgi:hypothetical protein